MSPKEAIPIEEVDVPALEKDEPRKPGRPVKDIEEGRRVNVSIAMSPKVLGRVTAKADELDISRSDLVNKMLAAYMDGITFENEEEFEAILDHWLDKKREEAEEEKEGKHEDKAGEESPKLEAKEDEGFLSDFFGF